MPFLTIIAEDAPNPIPKHIPMTMSSNIIPIITPIVNKTASYNNTILVNEVVIVGDVPQSYYNLTGIDETLPNASLNIID